MNPNNVIPYGEFVHKVASAGGPEEYEAAQRQLIENSFKKGIEEGRNQLIPWILFLGVTAVISSATTAVLGVKQFAPVVKKKFDTYREKRERLRKEAITEEEILVDHHEAIQDSLQGDNVMAEINPTAYTHA